MRTLASTRLTHHWYVPYAPYPLIRACAPTRLYPFSCLLTNTVVSVAPPAKKFRIFSFRPDTPFLGKFGPKNQNCKFELKFGTCTNLNKHNSMVVFSFSIFDRKCSFGEGGDKFGPKNQNYQFELKFGTWTNSNMHNSLEILTLSVFDQKYPF